MQKKNRILKSDDFNKLIKIGKKIKSNNLSIFYLKNNLNHCRVGISVSKKVSKLAVVRNKIKRRIKAIMTLYFNMETPIDLIIITKDTINNSSFDQLKVEIERCIRKINEIWK